ncbi:MAG: DUF6442 family protein [Sporomusa sp.]
MNRDEILEKSRKENVDEGLLTAQNQGRKIGSIAFCVVFIVIIVFNILNGLSTDAPLAMFWAYLAAEAYPMYKFTKNKSYIVVVIAGSLASIFSLANLVVSTLR